MCLTTNWLLMSRRYNKKKALQDLSLGENMLLLRESCYDHHESSFDAKKLFHNLHQNEQFKVPKLSNASSSKQMGNQANSFPSFYVYTKPQKIKTSMYRSKLLKFHLNQAGFGQGNSQSEILGENYVPIKKGSTFFDTKFNGIN